MYQRRRARVLLAVLVLVALVLVTVDFRTDGKDGQGPLGWARGALSSVLGPVQEGLATIVRPIGNAVETFSDVFELRAENERLRARLQALEARRVSYDDVARQNDELRALLDLQSAGDMESVAARVIDLGSSNFDWTITLDVGSNDGVERDMVVINGDGLVGRVIQVTNSHARVLLAIDPNFGAPGRVARNAEAGPITGAGGKPLVFAPFDPEADIEAGDEIVTSQYSNSSFPSGIPIGTVEEPGSPGGLLTRQVTVRPFVDFSRLDVVLVVLENPDRPIFPDRLPPDLPFNPPLIGPDPTDTPSVSETPSDPFAQPSEAQEQP